MRGKPGRVLIGCSPVLGYRGRSLPRVHARRVTSHTGQLASYIREAEGGGGGAEEGDVRLSLC